ncbi:MAG TPA: hypothetical protein VMN60_04140 [Longimicrobiales bacterium]|nr:hypothetical protein [Longimicrobiales bacterium]
MHAQRVELSGRAGVALSSPLVDDLIGTAPARQLLGGAVDRRVRVTPAPGPGAGVGVRVAFWPRAVLEGTLDWVATELRVQEDERERSLQRLDVVQVTVGASWSVNETVQLGGATGLLRYVTAERGIFAGGSDVSPLVGVRVVVTPPAWSRRAGLIVNMQTHRFGTQAMRDRGGLDGVVTRLDAGIRVRLVEFGR